MTAHDPRVTLTEVLAAHVRLPLMHSQACTCRWMSELSHPDLHRAHLAEQVEALFDARLAPIRALAERWEAEAEPYMPGGDWCNPASEAITARADCRWLDAQRLRAALDATSAPVSAQQDHDGAEGQP